MLTANGTYHNGTHDHYLNCASDYEPAPVIDVTPKTGWRDQLAPVTWSMSYVDSSGISHSCTLRGDTEEEVLDMVKPLVAGIRKAKQMAKERQPQATQTPGAVPYTSAPDSDIPPCPVHGTPMIRRQSKRTGGIYFSHKMPSGELCFGREPKG